MSKIPAFVLATLLVSANALAADSAPAADAAAPAANSDLEAQLASARQKLEVAAREVAQLSSQLGQSAMGRLQNLHTRAVLGLQLQMEPGAKEQGATVIGVSPGGPAAEAGIVAGDVIVALNGTAIAGPTAAREVVEQMRTVKPDSRVTVKVLREGKSREFQVTPRASVVDFLPALNGPGPGGPGGFNPPWHPNEMRPGTPGGGVGADFEGLELADMSPALGQYFGATQGVLVIRVPHDGDVLKLQDGDVIQSIDGRVPENGSHATRILRSYQPGEKIHLKVLRQKKSLEVEATLPEHRHGPGRGPGPGEPGDHPPPDHGPGPMPPPAGGAPST